MKIGAQCFAMIDSLTALSFSVFENKGVYSLLLGSGLSRAAQIPTGWEITIDLVRRLSSIEGTTEQIDWAAWYHGKYGLEPAYSQLLDAVAQSPSERRAILHSYIEPTAEDIDQGERFRRKPIKPLHGWCVTDLCASSLQRTLIDFWRTH